MLIPLTSFAPKMSWPTNIYIYNLKTYLSTHVTISKNQDFFSFLCSLVRVFGFDLVVMEIHKTRGFTVLILWVTY